MGTSFILFLGFIISLVFLIRYSSTNVRYSPTNDKNLASPGNTQVSPSGRFLLEVHEIEHSKQKYETFEIKSTKDNKLVYKCKEKYRTRDVLFFLWDKADRVWVYSGDVGTFYWEHNQAGEWNRYIYPYFDENYVGPEAPEFLKRIRPQFHLH